MNKQYKKDGRLQYKKDEKIQNKKREPKLSLLEVSVRNNDLEQAMRILKNKMSKDNILGELRKRRYYEKPSEIKRRQKREAQRKARPTKKKPWVKRSKIVSSAPIRKEED